jgi:membrane-associated phospholipid phosphatase
MNKRYLVVVVMLLLIPRVLLSQEIYSNNSIALNSNRNFDFSVTSHRTEFHANNNLFSNKYLDTLETKSLEINSMVNRPVQPHWIRASIVPAALIMTGSITLLAEPHTVLSKYRIHDEILNLFPNVNTPIDNYLQYAPLAAVFGLKACGVKSRSDFMNQVIISAKGELLMSLIVRIMKPTFATERPSGASNSMPSGHTAQAFLSAAILDMEYRDTSPWIGVSGYAIATTTGMLRMINNKHWISDVLVGAGIGIFSAKVVYYTHRYHRGKKSNMVILPAIYKNGGGVSFAMVL